MSASGINFLFIGVSKVTGRMQRAQELVGSPDPEEPEPNVFLYGVDSLPGPSVDEEQHRELNI